MESFPPYPIGPGQRALAAIVFTDVVSFSARMQADEDATLALLQRDFTAMKKLCVQHSGSVLKSTGDGLLLYFTSAVQAVAYAQRMQKYFARKARSLPAAEVLSHRVGIHLGDVFIHDQDVMGDGVNIAARLQAEAEPGGICISQTVFDVVRNKLDLQATRLGPRELKNISEVIPVYRLEVPEEAGAADGSVSPAGVATVPPVAATPALASTPERSLGFVVIVGSALLLLAGGGSYLAWQSRQHRRADLAQKVEAQAALRTLLETGSAAADYDAGRMARAIAVWREELRDNRSRAPDEYDFTSLDSELRSTKPSVAGTRDAALRRLALDRMQGVFGWIGVAMQRYTKERPLSVRELTGTAPMETKVFGGADRRLYSAEGGAIRQRNWSDLKPAFFGATVVAVIQDLPVLPPREIAQGAEIFAYFYGLPEMDSILRSGARP